jgi:pimeloyl-ACP methyl ester carboxylesterase
VASNAAGKRLPFSYWVQKTNAPVVYILPGLGAHRLSGGNIALAEVLYREGFSVVTMSSTFNYEFIENGSSSAFAGYVPVDANDVRFALEQMDDFLEGRHGVRLGKRALVGYSMGGFNTLYLAATERTNKNSLKFDRFVAIDAPVRLDYAVSQLDEYFRSAYQWPAQERTDRIEKTFLKVANLSSRLGELKPDSVIPFSETESKFIIGLAFRLSLRDAIFLSQRKNNMGVLKQPLNSWSRDALYREILQYSYSDYVEKFLAPYYQDRGVDLNDSALFAEAVDLRSYRDALRENQKVRVIENANDILLNEESVAWLRSTLPAESLTVFERGGHLGNLNHPAVQRAIVSSLEGLK